MGPFLPFFLVLALTTAFNTYNPCKSTAFSTYNSCKLPSLNFVKNRAPCAGSGSRSNSGVRNLGSRVHTELRMLPGRGPNNFNAAVASVVPSILFGLFLFSPLGSFLFTIFNSFLLLAIGLPLVGFVAFQVYIKFFTVEDACPACGMSNFVPKGDLEVTSCIQCGASLRVKKDGKGIELCNDPNNMVGQRGGIIDDILGDVFGVRNTDDGVIRGEDGTPSRMKKEERNERMERERRETKIIDIDPED